MTLRDGSHEIGTLHGEGSEVLSSNSSVATEPCEPLFLGYPHGPKTAEFVPHGIQRETVIISVRANGTLKGTLIASAEAFACQDRPDAILGTSFGKASSRNFNAIYDRKSDTLLTIEAKDVALQPTTGGFAVVASGPLEIRLKRDYVKNHLGYFLWNNRSRTWTKPVAGWCSWMAHRQDVTEANVRDAARFFGQNLKDYGYNVIQIDDGYQRASQSGEPALKPGERFADLWSEPNGKFPSGLGALAHEITSQGMIPGIWVGLFLPQGVNGGKGYVTGTDGKPYHGPWVNYAVNGLDSVALDQAYVEPIRDLKKQGWRYFKIDTLRHVLYDNYRKVPGYWTARHESPEWAYRTILEAIKKEVGPADYLLACWGTIPELAGIPDGCRIGEDVGPDVESMRRSAKYIAQFNYLNNVVWRNDPDYMCLRVPIPQAQTWATLTALAGGHIMVSDAVEDYDQARVSILRKVGPPLLTRPQNLAPSAPDPEFMTLAANKNGEDWLVAARFAWDPKAESSIDLAKLGLKEGIDYLVFDFWRSEFLGVTNRNANYRALDSGESQVLSFRPLLPHPQVLGTDRHIGQGAYELDRVKWNDGKLSGEMKRGPGTRWSLFVHVPKGWKLVGTPKQGDLSSDGEVIKLTFPEGEKPQKWSLSFARS